jgi:HlyD family secretion protein
MAKHSTRRRAIVGGVGGVAVIAAGTSAWALTASSGAGYRLATVESGNVVQSITTTGVLAPLRSSDLDFQVAGRVGRVMVRQGQHVKAGQVVARLERADLRAALTAAQSTMSNARETLTADEASQSSSSTSTGSSDATQPTATATPASTSGSTSTGTSSQSKTAAKRLQADQRAIVVAQHRADADLAIAKSALATETTACANELGNASASTATDSNDATATTCTDATKTLYADQTAVSKDQRAAQTAEIALTTDLAQSSAVSATRSTGARNTSHVRRATSATTASTPTEQSTTPTGTTPTSNGSSSSNQSGSTTVTASQLASDVAAIDSDWAAVATARASLREAVLHSPMSGRVVAVTIHRGESASGSSSSTSPAIEIVGSRQSEVTIGLSAAQVRTVTAGMKALVTADGSSKAVSGVVISVGLAASESSTGDSTYPVVIALSRRATSLVSGADAAVTLALAHASHALVVPTSAVHRSGTKAYVETLKNAKLIRSPVKVGAVGATTTQLLRGVSVGEQVVLADLDAKVPSSSSNLNSTGGSGRFRSFSGPVGAPGGGFAPPSSGGSLSVGGR